MHFHTRLRANQQSARNVAVRWTVLCVHSSADFTMDSVLRTPCMNGLHAKAAWIGATHDRLYLGTIKFPR